MMNILHIAPHVAPLSRADSGSGEAVRLLALAQAQLGDVRCQVISARSAAVQPEPFGLARRLRRIVVPLGQGSDEVEIWEGRVPGGGVPLYLIDHPLLQEEGAQRAALLGAAALRLAQEFELHPDVIHAHDTPAALALYFARHRARRPVSTVMSVYDMAAQGLFPLPQAEALGIDAGLLHPEGIEFYGQASLLKAGLLFADRIVVPSLRHAQEIQTPEFGYGLEGLMRKLAGRITGVPCGIDTARFSPAQDPYLLLRYGGQKALQEPEAFAEVPLAKERAKAELQRELGLLLKPHAPLCALIGPLSERQGTDLLVTVLDEGEVFRGDAQFVVLGRGPLEERVRLAARRHPGRMAVQAADPWDSEPLWHRLLAAADILIAPARVEPTGLLQLSALRYGALPVVRATGALDDHIIDYDAHSKSGTGFTFSGGDPQALLHTLRRALFACEGDAVAWHALMRRAMRVDLSPAKAARALVGAYQTVKATAG